jgi:3-dehydroquinate synthase class II
MQTYLQIYFGTVQGPVHAYVAIPGGKTCYLSELKAGKEVIVVDQKGQQRTAIVGRVKIETRPQILVEAKVCLKLD